MRDLVDIFGSPSMPVVDDEVLDAAGADDDGGYRVVWALAVACTRCGADAGDLCHGQNNTVVTPHARRKRAAAQAPRTLGDA